MPIDFQEFASRDELAESLATGVGQVLQAAIDAKGRASLAVSGGSTPKGFFARLSRIDLDWSRVTVTLVDERWVGPESERSNARLVAENLLQDKAASANFIPLFVPDNSVEASIPGTERSLKENALPLDVCILGMGSDGHTASFFPGGSHLATATDTGTHSILSPMQAEGAGEQRITLTLPPILAADYLALHIEGKEKKSVLQNALHEGDPHALPIRHVLRNTGKLTVYWAE